MKEGQRMLGAVPPLPNIPSCRGAQFKKSIGTTLHLPLVVHNKHVKKKFIFITKL
jgi:hypothetical protein